MLWKVYTEQNRSIFRAISHKFHLFFFILLDFYSFFHFIHSLKEASLSLLLLLLLVKRKKMIIHAERRKKYAADAARESFIRSMKMRDFFLSVLIPPKDHRRSQLIIKRDFFFLFMIIQVCVCRVPWKFLFISFCTYINTHTQKNSEYSSLVVSYSL